MGRWTPIGNSWQHEQIHLVLLRGDGTYHSKLLSWANFYPYASPTLWGWNPSAGTADNDCSAYPLTQFTSLPVGSEAVPPIFCGGHSSLANGDLLISGGHDGASNAGLKQAIVFRANPTPTWTVQQSMAQGRWYPTNTTLPNGDVMAFAGTRFWHAPVFGGTSAPQNATGAATDDINRLGLSTVGESMAAVTRPLGELNWPGPREGHSAVWHPSQARMIVFGGRRSGTITYERDSWGLNVAETLTNGYAYSWEALPDAPCTPRTRHSAIIRVVPGETSMIVYGGLDSNGPCSDVWKLQKVGAFWQWSQITTTGSQTPGARYGHAAVYDADNDRMLVFGGRSSTSNPGLADNDVYQLTFSNSTWSRLNLQPATRPPARDGHSMVVDPMLRSGSPFPDLTVPTDQRIVLFGGQEGGGGALKRDVWVLWINRATDSSKGAIQWVSMGEPAGLSARTRHAAFWDVTVGTHSFDRMIVSGGDTLGGATATTWSLGHDLNLWSALEPASPPLAGHTALYHPLNLRAVVPERYSAASGTWTQHTAAPRLQIYYPFTFVLPSGKLFVAGPNPTEPGYRSLKYDPATQIWSVLGGFSGFDGGSAVTYEPGKIMKCGNDSEPVSGTTKKITIDANDNVTSAGWVESANTMLPRTFHNTTILPNGQVLVTGGIENRSYESDSTITFGTRPAQIWDPNGGPQQQGQWSPGLAIEPVRRAYHSTAVLLPDGRVLSAGGEIADPSHPAFNPNHDKPTIFCPPYLFASDGTLAPRPTISSASDTIGYDSQPVQVFTDEAASIASACLIRPGADTHAYNQDQRYVPLPIAWTEANEVRLVGPANANEAPPGDYMLFIVNQTGVPCVARWVRVRPGDTIPRLDVPGDGEIPTRYALRQNRPNPFSHSTSIAFALPVASHVKLEIFDLQGRRVRRLLDAGMTPGNHAVDWDHRLDGGRAAKAGVYLYRLTAGSFRDQKRLTLTP